MEKDKIKKYDDYEIDFIGTFKAPTGNTFDEPLVPWEGSQRETWLYDKTPLITTYWSVFGHLTIGGRESIADFQTEGEAIELYNLLTKGNKK